MRYLLLILLACISIQLQAQINWQTSVVQEGATLNKMVVFDSATAIITGSKSTLKRTTDAGLSWVDVDLPESVDTLDDVFFSDMQFSGDTGYLVHRTVRLEELGKHDKYANSQLLVSYNKGINWEIVNYSGTNDETNNPATSAYADSSYNVEIFSLGLNKDGKLYISLSWDERNGNTKVDHSYIYSSEDMGNTWVKEIDSDLGSATINAILLTENRGFIGGNKILLELQNGSEWVDISPKLIAANGDDDIFFVNDLVLVENDILLIPTSTDGIFSYNFATQTLDEISTLGTNDVLYFEPNTYFAFGTTSKTYYVKNGVVDSDASLPGVTLYDAGGIMGQNVFALAKSNVYYFNINDLALPIEKIVPLNELKIYQSSHNTLIADMQSSAQLDIYNLRGQRITSTRVQKGKNTIDIPNLKRGVYLVRAFTYNGHTSTLKLLIE